MLNSSERYLQKQYYYELIQQLIGKHTLKIWSVMCSFVLIIGALAVVGLLDPGFDPTDAQQNSSSSTLNSGESAPPTATLGSQRRRATAAKIIVVLLGSLAGGWVITYNLKNAKWSFKAFRQRVSREKVKRKVRARPQSNSSRASKQKVNRPERVSQRRPSRPAARVAKGAIQSGTARPRPQNQSATPNRHPLPAQPNSLPTRSLQPPHSVRPPALPQPQPALAVSALALREEPQITVVPAETIMPLDRREPTLAEVMDLRKRHTIASIMGGTKDTENNAR